MDLEATDVHTDLLMHCRCRVYIVRMRDQVEATVHNCFYIHFYFISSCVPSVKRFLLMLYNQRMHKTVFIGLCFHPQLNINHTHTHTH